MTTKDITYFNVRCGLYGNDFIHNRRTVLIHYHLKGKVPRYRFKFTFNVNQAITSKEILEQFKESLNNLSA